MTARFAIATAAYPTSPIFIEQFFDGVQAAAQKFEKVKLVVASERGVKLPPVPAGVELGLHHATESATPAGLRRLMIEAARQSTAEIVVFCDFDDRLLPESFDRHTDALASADISYGPMELMDERGSPLGDSFPKAAAMPAEISNSAALLGRNFMGFSNTAVRRSAITQVSAAIPEDLVAADWWFFTMLLSSGRRAKQAQGAVANYRVYAQNMLGSAPAKTPEDLLRRAKIVERHYAAVGDKVDVAAHKRTLSKLINCIERDAAAGARIVSQLPRNFGAWFEDVAAACRLAESI